MGDRKSILIIGGGVIGLCAAWYSALRGHRVTVVDPGDAARDNCSIGNAGMIVPSHFVPLAAPGMVGSAVRMMLDPASPFYIRPRLDWGLVDWGMKFCRAATPRQVARAGPLLRDLHMASRACFEELAREFGNEFGLIQRGLLMLCRTEHGMHEESRAAEFANRMGMPAEVMDARQVAQLEPGIRMDVAGGVYYPRDCHLSPARFMAGLQRRLESMGVSFAWRAGVKEWRWLRGRIDAVMTTVGRFAADEFVLCGGAWSSALGRQIGLNLPLQAGRGYSLTLSKPRQLPALCAILVEARIAVTPMAGQLRFAGTMEIDAPVPRINPTRVNGIIRSIPRYFPEFSASDFAAIHPWSGLRPCSPDGLPYLGRTRRFDNLTIATGHAMMGLSLAPITGQLVADLVSNTPTPLGLSLLTPDRYAR